MNTQFGDVYAQSVAKDFVFDQLGGRTVERALADGVDAKGVWRAPCDTFKGPQNPRQRPSRRGGVTLSGGTLRSTRPCGPTPPETRISPVSARLSARPPR